MKQAVILAAGRGRRLGPILNGKPKCLLEVGGKSLIGHQVETLRELGVEQICVVVGYGAAYVYDALDDDIAFVVNPRYADTNSLFSLWLTAAWIKGPFMLMNSDVLAHPDIYRRILESEKTCLAYDSTSGSDEEEMKIQLLDGRVRAISKTMPAAQADGENVGIIHFKSHEAAGVLREADRLIRKGKTDHWSPAAIDGIVNKFDFGAEDIADLPWTEIDFPADLDKARTKVWPQLQSLMQTVSNGRTNRTENLIVNVRQQSSLETSRGATKPAAGSIYRIPAWPMA